MHEIHVPPFFEFFSPAFVVKFALKCYHCRYKNLFSSGKCCAIHNIPMIMPNTFSLLWSKQFRTYLHLAFKIPKARSKNTSFYRTPLVAASPYTGKCLSEKSPSNDIFHAVLLIGFSSMKNFEDL